MTDPINVDLSKLNTPSYKGSVQNLYYLEQNDDVMVCETTDSGSVFDVGSIFSIPGSDLCRAALRHHLYSQLQNPKVWQSVAEKIQKEYGEKEKFLTFLGDGLLEKFQSEGARTHHLGMVDPLNGTVISHGFPSQVSPFVLVERFNIIKPKPASYRTNHFWDYTPYLNQERFVIPLENIVRFGITSGSSIYQKFLRLEEKQRKSFLKELGVNELPLWQFFQEPIVDFTSKYEPEDRGLTYQEALHISGCDADGFLNLVRMPLLGSFLIQYFFKSLNLTLWDIKWEIAKKGDEFIFVDTIDTDSLRVTCTVEEDDGAMFVHFNKQSMRDYYKILHSDWYESLNLAKKAAATEGVPFHEILEAGQKSGKYPNTPTVSETFLKIQERKFSVLLTHLLESPSSEETSEEIQSIAREEISYYKKAGVIHSFLALNGLRR